MGADRDAAEEATGIMRGTQQEIPSQTCFLSRRNILMGCDSVKKRAVYRILSIMFGLLALLMIAGSVTVTGSGFLDLSNVVKGILVGMAILCFILTLVLYFKAK